MPIPIPRKDKKKDKNINHCMAFTVGTEKRPQNQAYAICLQKWNTHLRKTDKGISPIDFLIELELKGLLRNK